MVDYVKFLDQMDLPDFKVFGVWGYLRRMASGATSYPWELPRRRSRRRARLARCLTEFFQHFTFKDGPAATKLYEGIKGFSQWAEFFLQSWIFKDCKDVMTFEGPDGSVCNWWKGLPTISGASKQGETIEVMEKLVFKDGKVCSWKYYWGPTMAKVDALFLSQ